MGWRFPNGPQSKNTHSSILEQLWQADIHRRDRRWRLGMTSSILAFCEANSIIPLLAAVGYVVYREVGTAAAAAFGQYFVNASSLSRTYAISGAGERCSTVVIFLALLPLLVFATLPSVHFVISRRQGRTRNASSFLIIFALLFAALSANYCLLALNDVPMAGDAASGAFLIASLFAVGAITLDKLSSERLSVAAQPSAISPAYSVEMPGDMLAEPWTNVGSVEVGVYPTSGENEAPPNPVRILHRPRPEPISSAAYLFNRNEFFIYRHQHLKDLEDLLRREPPGVLEGLHVAICRRLGRLPVAGDEHAFVRAYVTQFRKRIETCYPSYFAPERLERLAA